MSVQSPASELPAPPPSGLWREHLALLVSAGLIMACLLRVYSFTLFNVEASLAVLRVADRTQLLLATVVSGAGMIAYLACTLLPIVGSSSRLAALFRYQRPIIGMLFVVLVITAPVLLPILAAVVLLLTRGLVALGRGASAAFATVHHWLMSVLTSMFTRVLSGITALVLLLLPWQHLEKLYLEHRVLSGVYVMGSDGEQTLVVHRSRRLEWVQTDSIRSRSLCSAGSERWYTSTAPDLLRIFPDPNRYADCHRR